MLSPIFRFHALQKSKSLSDSESASFLQIAAARFAPKKKLLGASAYGYQHPAQQTRLVAVCRKTTPKPTFKPISYSLVRYLLAFGRVECALSLVFCFPALREYTSINKHGVGSAV